LLRAVDLAAFAVALSRRLRAAGIRVDLTATETFSRSLAVLPPTDRRRLYWLARTTLVRDPRDLPAYDAVFPVGTRRGRERERSGGSFH
jgi:uncharacterized protein with von Willebrand factor type A (vWA) domain